MSNQTFDSFFTQTTEAGRAEHFTVHEAADRHDLHRLTEIWRTRLTTAELPE